MLVKLMRSLVALLLLTCVSNEAGAQDVFVAQRPKTPAKSKAKAGTVLSNLPDSIQELSSENFLLKTDLAADDATELLSRLEKMIRLISVYYGKPNSQTIEIYAIDDLKHWPVGTIPNEVLPNVKTGGGITLNATTTLMNESGERQVTSAKSVVWAAAQRGVPQHEAVHAYCHQNFGRTGPTWYAEGMAELGKYWRDKDESVQIDRPVLMYLKNSEPKSLAEITAVGQQTGDGWQNYAWRWALCHLLATNPNYSPRFKPLGLSLLSNQRARFEDVYGSMSKEISFEYLFFLKHLQQGYRCDCCAWDWKTKFQRLRGSSTAQVKVSANRGWQASRVMLKTGDKISWTSSGEWSFESEGPLLTADGNAGGQGRLVGVLMNDYQLSDAFDLGAGNDYQATSEGNLYLRCQDDWGEIADNRGVITVKFKVAD